MKIRRATKKDIPALMKFAWELQTHHFAFGNSQQRELFRFRKDWRSGFRKLLNKWLRARNTRIYIAECDGKAIGHMLAMINRIYAEVQLHGREVYVAGIYVRKAYRGKGIGKRFLKEAEKWAKQRKIFSVGLNVHVNNKDALTAYKKSGYWSHTLKMAKIV